MFICPKKYDILSLFLFAKCWVLFRQNRPKNMQICSTFVQADPVYNALEKDIAVVNLYFGSSTVYGD